MLANVHTVKPDGNGLSGPARRIAYRIRERLIGMGTFEEIPEHTVIALAEALDRWRKVRAALRSDARFAEQELAERDLARGLASSLGLVRSAFLAAVGADGADSDLLRLME